MQRFWARLAVELGKRAGLVAVIGLLVTFVLGLGLTKLEFATGQDSYLNEDDVVFQDNVRYQDLFGGQAMLVLFTADDGNDIVGMMSEANQAEMDRIAAELNDRPELIASVVTPKTALVWSDALLASPDGNPANSVAGKALLSAVERDQSEEGKAARTADSLATLEALSAIPVDQRTLANPAYVDFLLHDARGDIRKSLLPVFPDDTHAQMVVRLVGNASIDEEGAGADLVAELVDGATFEGVEVTVTGAPVLLKDINDYLKSGMLQLGAIAVVIMMIILLLLFDVRWRLLPLGVVLIGVTWAFGLAGHLGIPLSLVTIAGLPVMLGVGIDYAIQMHARVEEEVVINRDPHPIQTTARNLCPALLVVTFDAVFAFAALRFAQVPMIRMFGLLLAIGIAVICFASIIVPLASLGIREFRSPTKGRDYQEGALAKFVLVIGSLPAKLGPFLAVGSLAIFAGGIAVEDDLVLQTDPEQWVDQSSQSIADLNSVKAQTGSASELGVFVESDDVFDQATVDFIWTFAEEQMTSFPEELLTASSVVTTIGYVLDVPGATPLGPTAEDARAAYEVAPPDIQRSTVSYDGRAANLIFRYGPGSLEDRAVVVNEISDTVRPPEGVTATPSGLAVVGVGLLENLESNRVMLTYLAIAFVFAFLAVRLRSLIRALLSMVPVLIAVGTASLVAFAFNLKLSPMTAVGGPLVVAVCTEFTSLILLRFVEERARGRSPQEAVDVTARRTGRAFSVSALTAIAGVAVIATSSLPLLRDFGIIVAMNVAVALLSALVILPPLLVWADQHNWVSKGIVDRLRVSASHANIVDEPGHENAVSPT